MNKSIAVVGLGYVGLPLAVEFGKRFPTVGFDIDAARVDELEAGHDRTRELTASQLAEASGLRFSRDANDLLDAAIIIITVPTPVDGYNRPDLRPLEAASRTVGEHLRSGDIVIYESTVYPGTTEEVCVPILEQASGLLFNQDFSVGYSPERINPGDKQRRLPDIVKITSGSNPEAAQEVDDLYATIITAGTHRAPSIKVAEAAKVIENTQRDVNIALVNELAQLFNKLGVDTQAVLQAAGTKWNFLPFTPGLVGGHCIGVDPYYLTHKATEVGHHPEIIVAGRRINNTMGSYVADQVVLQMAKKGLPVGGTRALILGLAFKENCPDLRNTRVVDIIGRLRDYGIEVDVTDPWVDPAEANQEYGLDLVDMPESAGTYSVAILAVNHDDFDGIGPRLRRVVGPQGVIYDVKGALPAGVCDASL